MIVRGVGKVVEVKGNSVVIEDEGTGKLIELSRETYARLVVSGRNWQEKEIDFSTTNFWSNLPKEGTMVYFTGENGEGEIIVSWWGVATQEVLGFLKEQERPGKAA